MKYSEYLMKVAKQIERCPGKERCFICIQNSKVFRSLYEEAFRMQDVKGIKEVLLYRDNLNSFIYKKLQKEAKLRNLENGNNVGVLYHIFGFGENCIPTETQRKEARINLLTRLAKYHAARGN